ncbi:MAG: fumarate hydratase [Bacteroidales bacterium]|jgi:fumarate hydratase subunit alpha|nr:fumarate hydratase [Bacteroidales bacterium]
MRKISVENLTKVIRDMAIEASTIANPDLIDAIENAKSKEQSEVGKAVLNQLLENIEIARNEKTPICQDTGFTVIYMDVGQEVQFVGGDVNDAINNGVAKGYVEGFLRKSIVENPITDPKNTGNNTPAIIHTHIVPGDKVKITMLPKGGGSENMSRLKMMKPADGVEGIRDFVIETVSQAGGNPCPPTVIGVAIGGTFDYVAHLAKKAVTRKFGERNPNPKLAELEVEWLAAINKLGIGPAGLGGNTTSLDLFIEEFPRHIATFPVAVNIQCHAARVKTKTI